MDIVAINNFLSTDEYTKASGKYKKTDEYYKFKDFLTKIPINTKYYNNSNKYNATYAQLYKRKQGSNIEACTKRMNILLNKLTNLNIDEIVEECNIIILECAEIVPKMIESIFMKCSAQHSLCKNYIELLLRLPQKDIKVIIQRKTDLYMNKILEDQAQEDNSEESYDEFCDRLKQKSFWVGYSLFLTHLHNKKYIDIENINKIMDIMVNKVQEVDESQSTDKETLVQCLHAISMNIDSVDKLDAYIPLLQEMIDSDILEMKLQFQLQDILDRFAK